MKTPSRTSTALKALTALGPGRLALYASYQFALRSGLLRLRLQPVEYHDTPAHPHQFKIHLPAIPFPERATLETTLGDQLPALFAEADEILAGQVRLFGDNPRPLELTPPAPVKHATLYGKQIDGQDIKLTWEPARFNYATVLARAYHLSRDEKYAAAFWETTEGFLRANPPYLGPHWTSAQEVALRQIALVFSFSVFADSPNSTPERVGLLGQALAAHAARIPPTLTYARAQNNNHLLIEALGLYTAALVLPDHPKASRWHRLGWRWLNHSLQRQIAPNGTYVQHSTNYHRLMLSAALWAAALAKAEGQSLPEKTQQRLGTATSWLLALTEPANGHAPNLGPNDGATLLPLTTSPFADHRPVLQAAGMAFLDGWLFGEGPWNETALWLAAGEAGKRSPHSKFRARSILLGDRTWAYLRSAYFADRPGHADQLHLDLWWRGLNLAQDAGTYLYNADPPWNNALAATSVHNTLTVNGLDQMSRAGRFLWLDWAQAFVLEENRTESGVLSRLSSMHDGYRALGLAHKRTVEYRSNATWLVSDVILALRPDVVPDSQFTVRLHWLLPDWAWELEEATLHLQSPFGRVSLSIESELPRQLTIARAGQLLHGPGPVSPVQGWVSPTYAHKIPTLSLAAVAEGHVPITITTQWRFPD